VKLRHLERWNGERRERAAAYSSVLADVPSIVLPRERAGARSAWHLYTIRTAGRDALGEALKGRGISTAVHYPKPIHLQASLSELGGRAGDLPVSESLSREVLSLPLYPEMSIETATDVAEQVRDLCRAAAL
jgi:dTDP-4-amino-4,6-dideoxygalactose transaminase